MSSDNPIGPAEPYIYFPAEDLSALDADQLRSAAESYRIGANHFYNEFRGAIESHAIANEALRGVLDALGIPAHERKISGKPSESAPGVAYRHFHSLARGRTGGAL
jgi:hypothetical protein